MTDIEHLALQEATLKALADEVDKRYRAVRAELQAAFDKAHETTGATVARVTVKTPDGTKVGTVSARGSGDPIAAVDDRQAFLEWAVKNAPTEITRRIVTEVRPAYESMILDQMTAAGAPRIVDADGVITEVPGVSVRPRRSRNHAMRVTDAPAIICAWRAGELPMLPDIEQPGITDGTA